MIKNITSRLAEINNPEEAEFREFIREYSNEELIDAAQSFRYSSFNYKVSEFLLPAFRAQEREIARKILSEKGIDYKIKEKILEFQK